MSRKNNIVAFLGIENPSDLIGKVLKVSWVENEESLSVTHFFTVNSFSVESNNEIHFPPIVIGQGGEMIQVSIFGDNEFHIVLLDNYKKTEFQTPIEKGYFYSTKQIKSTNISKGKIEIVK